MRFSAPAFHTSMGGTIQLPTASSIVRFRLAAERARGQQIDVIRNGTLVSPAPAPPIAQNEAVVEFDIPVQRGDWVRINLRDSAGVTVIANPVYFR